MVSTLVPCSTGPPVVEFVMRSSYSIQLVLLSYVVAVLASHVTLSLAQRLRPLDGMRNVDRPLLWPWIVGGAFSMGTGIWSMHFIGMLAFHLPVQVVYDLPLTGMSYVIAVVVSGVALQRFHRNDTTVRGIALPGAFIGFGIAAMHYTGMAAMRMSPGIDYDPLLFATSVLIAIAAAVAALWIAFSLPQGQGGKSGYKLAAASVMGAAIVGMHYTGMAAAHFAPNAVCIASGPRMDANWLAITIAAFTCLILGSTLLLSIIDAQLQSTVARSAEALRMTNEELEQRVLDRTRQLEAANQQLVQEARERQRAEETIRSGQNLLQGIVDNSMAVIYVKDLAGRYLLVNRRYEDIFGLTREAVLGHTDYELFSKAAADNFRAMDERVAAAGYALTEEETVPQADGVHTYLSVKFPLHDAAGRPYAVSGISTDITERERELKAQAQLAAIVQSADEAIISKTLDGIITSWNPGAQRLFGYSAEEALGKSITMLIPPERLDEEFGIRARLLRGEDTDHFETVRMRKDGSPMEVSVTISPIRNNRGELTGASKIARDITERRHAEHRLRAQLAKLDLLSRTTRAIGERQDSRSILQVAIRRLEEDLPIDFGCVCLYEAAGRVLTVACVGGKSQPLALRLAMPENAQIEVDQNGLSPCVHGQLVYEPDITQLPFPFPRRLAEAGLGSLVAAPLMLESKVFGVVFAARRKVGQFTSSDCEFLRQLSEHLALALHQAELYGALQRAYEDLRQTQQSVMQQERLRVLGQLASGIAHDINNALSPAALYAQSLLEGDSSLSRKARDYLIVIQRAIEGVAHTVARMKEFYRQREPQGTHASVNLNRVLEQVIDLTRARWSAMPQERGVVIHMQTDLAAGLPTIMGAESEIRDALTNLVLNAVDAMPQGGILTLRTQVPEPTQVRVEVIDTGIGMDEATRTRCLEPFFTTKGERGTGLGLAMVYGMLERHGGEVQIESEPGRGTSIRLNFPAAVDRAVTGDGREIVPPQRPSQPLRILFVDDDPIVLRSLGDTLEQDGHVVVLADGGQRGIETFRAAHERGEPFAAVITDLGMPHVDGRTVAVAIKSRAPEVPVILLTGWGHRLLAENDRPPSVDRVLSKPPKLAALRLALAELCSRDDRLAR